MSVWMSIGLLVNSTEQGVEEEVALLVHWVSLGIPERGSTGPRVPSVVP